MHCSGAPAGAGGHFARARPVARGAPAPAPGQAVSPGRLGGYSKALLLELARFVQEVQPEALWQVAGLLADAPWALPAFSLAALVLLRRSLSPVLRLDTAPTRRPRPRGQRPRPDRRPALQAAAVSRKWPRATVIGWAGSLCQQRTCTSATRAPSRITSQEAKLSSGRPERR